MKLAFSIAFRFLRSAKVQTFLIALGIAIGVAVQIFIGSLIQGLQRDLVDTTIGSQSQITVRADDDEPGIENYDEVIETIEKTDGVRDVSPAVEGQSLISNDDKSASVLIRGLDFEASEGIYKLTVRLVDGTLPEADEEVLIGQELYDDLGVKIGDTIDVLTNEGEPKTATISGIFDLETASLNRSWLLTTLETAQSYFALDDLATSIEMQVDDVFAADTLATSIASTLPDQLRTEHWKEQNAALLSGLEGQSISSYMIQIFVMVSVLLGIASVLAITVIQKSKQIGILKAMGIGDKEASLIFLFQGLMLGVLGAIFGILLGLGLAYAFTTFALNADGTPVVPLTINPGFIALSALFAVTVSTLAALIPARKSARLNPIEVIRNG